MPSFIEIPPLSTEIPRHAEYVHGRTDGQTGDLKQCSAAYCWRTHKNTAEVEL